MSEIVSRLRELLDDNQVDYECLAHPMDYTARQTAADTHTPPREFAKTVFVFVDGDPAMVVLPASGFVATEKLRHALGATRIRLANEPETKELCPDCDVGAAPPFGNIYDLPVYASPLLSKDERITFNAGAHDRAVRLHYADYEKLVRPRIVPLSTED